MVRSNPQSAPSDTEAVTDPAGDESVSDRVVHAVARARDEDPLAIPPLYDVLDPDALNKLFDASGPADRTVPGRIVFGLAGCAVTVYSDGRVEVDAGVEPRVASPLTDGTGASGAESSAGE